MMKLYMGVIDVSYADTENTTTGEVAQDLEGRYGILDFFTRKYGQEIADDAVETYLYMLDGKTHKQEEGFEVLGATGEKFRRFLENKEMDGSAKGIPTKASLMGVSSRFKKKRGAPRPSFIDTGLYSATFTAWIEQ
jgi:hypothetical protein